MEIHRVKTRLVNSYVIAYPERILVVDVAVKCHRHVLGYIEQDLGRAIDDVALVTCTHDDPDHMGGVLALAQLCAAEVALPLAAGRGHRKLFNNPTGPLNRIRTSARESLRPRAWNMYMNPARDRAAAKAPQLAKDTASGSERIEQSTSHRLKDGHSLPGFDDWQVIHTPGHTWDSCCYYHPQSGSLISGDTLLGSAKINRLVTPSIYSSRRQTLRSLAKLAQLKINTVYPGHGSVISGNDLIGRHNLP